VGANVSDPGIAGLLERLQSPDRVSAWEEFLHEYSPVLYQAARVYTNDSDSAADCYLFACEELARNSFRRLVRFNPEGPASFKTWLLVVCRNLCLDWHRKRTGRPRPFKSLQSLSDLEFQIYVCRFERGFSTEQTLEHLRAASPNLDLDQIEGAERKIELCLNSRQRWMLSMRRQPSSNTTTAVMPDDDGDPVSEIPDARPDQEMFLVEQQQHEQMMQCLDTLPKHERLLLQLRFEEDLSLEEIARITSLGDAQRAHRHIAAVLQKLRSSMGKRGKF